MPDATIWSQDVIQFWALSKTLGLVMLTKPQIIPSIFKQVCMNFRGALFPSL